MKLDRTTLASAMALGGVAGLLAAVVATLILYGFGFLNLYPKSWTPSNGEDPNG